MQNVPPQSNATRGSEVAYVTGESLEYVETIDAFMEEFPELFSNAIQDLEEIALEELKEMAERDTQWKPYVHLIKVEFKDSELQFFLEGDPAEVNAAMRVEYGMPDSPPSALLRKYAASSAEENSELLVNLLMRELLSDG